MGEIYIVLCIDMLMFTTVLLIIKLMVEKKLEKQIQLFKMLKLVSFRCLELRLGIKLFTSSKNQIFIPKKFFQKKSKLLLDRFETLIWINYIFDYFTKKMTINKKII